MLRLVHVRGDGAPRELRRVTIWGMDGELATYIERRLRARWPDILVQRAGDPDQLEIEPADLWICGAEPPAPRRAPTLWLGEIDRVAGVVPVGHKLWKCSTPLTGRQLLRSVDEIWRQVG